MSEITKKSKNIFRKKIFWILIIILGLAGLYYYHNTQNQKIEYETYTVKKENLKRTVEATGEVTPAGRIDLAFESTGQLKFVNVEEGDKVKKGDLLAELEDQDLKFAYQRALNAVRTAQANLNARLAGSTKEAIQVAQAQEEQAHVAYKKSQQDLENIISQNKVNLHNAEIAVQTAQHNLDNSSVIVEQSLENAIETARISLLSALGPINSALVEGDAIVGVDDTATNQMYKNRLGILDSTSMAQAETDYALAKDARDQASNKVNQLSKKSTQEEVLFAVQLMQKAIKKNQTYLLDVKNVLANTIPSTYFPESSISAKKTLIDSQYTSLASQKTVVVSAKQAVESAVANQDSQVTQLKDALQSAQVSYNQIKLNGEIKIKNAQLAIETQKAGWEVAKANLAVAQAKPRAVDIAGLKAQLADARTALAQADYNLSKARIYAPTDGTITKKVFDPGEEIAMNVPVLKMIGTEKYDIEAQIPEADIVKVKPGQEVDITLDAYGDDLIFKGTVLSENPDQTKIQDAIYYKVNISIDPQDKEIKPGMTANVTIFTAEKDNVLVIPSRTIKHEDNHQFVRTLVNNEQIINKNITTGLKGDEGRIEITSGLEVGDKIILREKKKK